jgi:hypothetical protein
MAAVGMGLLILSSVVAAGVSLMRSFAAVEGYSQASGDQLRVSDYISLDSRRAWSVSVANGILTFTIPGYYDANGTPTNPDLDSNSHIIYSGRSFADGVTTSGSPNVTSSTAAFSSTDVGRPITDINTPSIIPANTTIQSATSSSAIVMSANANATGANVAMQIGTIIKYYQQGSFFVREVNGIRKSIATNVASFTVNPNSNGPIACPDCLTCTITFSPSFGYLASADAINGTTVVSFTFPRGPAARGWLN